MLTDLQKEKVQALVKAALEVIEGWDPRKKCELAIRAAVMVSVGIEGSGFRERTGSIFYVDNAIFRKISGDVSLWRWHCELSYDRCLEVDAVYDALNAAWHIRKGLHEREEFMFCVFHSLLNAKLCAMERGVKFELIDLIVEMENESRAGRGE